MRRSLILDTVTRGAFPLVIVFSLYLVFVGHNAPGGGFVSGLTAGIALVLLYIGGGGERLRHVVRLPYEAVLGLGLLIATATGLGSLVLGEPLMSSAILHAELPLLGEVKLVTVLFFDIGVDLIVIGLVLALLTVLGLEHTAIGSVHPRERPEPEDVDVAPASEPAGGDLEGRR